MALGIIEGDVWTGWLERNLTSDSDFGQTTSGPEIYASNISMQLCPALTAVCFDMCRSVNRTKYQELSSQRAEERLPISVYVA